MCFRGDASVFPPPASRKYIPQPPPLSLSLCLSVSLSLSLSRSFSLSPKKGKQYICEHSVMKLSFPLFWLKEASGTANRSTCLGSGRSIVLQTTAVYKYQSKATQMNHNNRPVFTDFANTCTVCVAANRTCHNTRNIEGKQWRQNKTILVCLKSIKIIFNFF